MLTGGRYFIGTPTSEERIQLLYVVSSTQITVARGFEASAPGAWPAGARMKKLSPVSGFAGNVEWGCTISNIAVTGDGSLKVGGGSDRIEEADARCKYTGFWEDYKYGAVGWPSQWWSKGHAKRTAPSNALDVRKVTLAVLVPAPSTIFTLGPSSTPIAARSPSPSMAWQPRHRSVSERVRRHHGQFEGARRVAAGTHTVEITATFTNNAASSGYYFYFDYLWPLEPQDVPDAPQIYTDVSLAMDFDTDHGYKKPPAWHLWQLQKLGFKGHADVYMGVFWNNKRRRINATYPYATVVFSGTPVAGDVVSFSIGGTTISHAIGYGETLQGIVSDMRAIINGMFSGVWADDNFGSSTTLRIQSKAPSWTYTGVAVSAPNSVTLTLTDHLGTAGADGDWEMIDAVSPVMTEGARKWIRDLAGQFQAAGIRRRSRSRWSAISLRPRCARSTSRTPAASSRQARTWTWASPPTRCTSARASGRTCARCTRSAPTRSKRRACRWCFSSARRSGGISTTRRRTRTAGCPTTTRTLSATSPRPRATRSGRSGRTRMIPLATRRIPTRPPISCATGSGPTART